MTHRYGGWHLENNRPVMNNSAMAQTERKQSMWKKILWQVMRIGISAIPWTEIAEEVIDWVREKLKEADGITGDDLINRVEEILARVTGLDIDINKDGI